MRTRIVSVPEVPVAEAPGEAASHLTPAQWAEIVELWELGEVKMEELTTRFGISISGLSKGLKKRGVTRGSRAHEVAARIRSAVLATKAEDATTTETIRQDRIRETRDEHYKVSKFISGQITAAMVRVSKSPGGVIADEMGNLKAWRMAAAALAITRNERFAVLNANDDLGEGELPTLPMEDLSEAEILEYQRRDDNDDELLSDITGIESDIVDLGD